MSINYLEWLRTWFPFPTRERGFKLRRWILLEGDRYAVTAALLSITFSSIVTIGSIWTFEMQVLLTETSVVQQILATLLSGIILLVSIVVSINSIVLSHDITTVNQQERRIEGIIEFRREIGGIVDTDMEPTDPKSFLKAMARVIRRRAESLESVGDNVDEESREAFMDDIADYIHSVATTAEDLHTEVTQVQGGDLYALWLGLETDYGPMMNRMREFTSSYGSYLTDEESEEFEELMRLFKMFATGREYFKTLYYNREVSELSRTLLVVSLPSIIIIIWAMLVINAGLLPDFWLFGLSPLLTFVALTFTIALAPYIILTSYMLRVATVTSRSSTAGPFILRD